MNSILLTQRPSGLQKYETMMFGMPDQLFSSPSDVSRLSSFGSLNLTMNRSPVRSNASAIGRGGPAEPVPLKTPVSLLNELTTKTKTVPVFHIIEEGPPHDKVFECKVVLQQQGMAWEGVAKARAKKDAKQMAAKALLLSMDENVSTILAPTKGEAEHESPQPTLDCDPEVEGNPVGELNDICVKIKKPPPEYEDVGEEGKPHERVYIVACKLGEIVEQGRGRSKKNAKKVAANKVKLRLTELIRENELIQADCSTSDVIDDLAAKLKTISVDKTKKGKSQFALNEWVTEFRNRAGEKLSSLSVRDAEKSQPTCPLKLFREIADEQKFKVEYFDEEKLMAAEDKFFCIISVGLEPVAFLFHGYGGSKNQARKSAAAKAVDFLRAVTLK